MFDAEVVILETEALFVCLLEKPKRRDRKMRLFSSVYAR
jgi:hypothetical protein